MASEAGHEDALRAEQRWLRFSTLAAAGFSVVAIAWGLAASSQIVLLDGVYALIGVVLGAVSLKASKLVEGGPTPYYPFGRESLAPLVVGIQGLVLLGSLAFAAVEAIGTVLGGGSSTSFGVALAYGVVSAVVGALVWRLLSARADGSELVQAEAAQWLAGALLSLGMVAGFATALLLRATAWEWVVPYIDPAMVLVAVLVIAPTPLSMLGQMYRELLEGVPPAELREEIDTVVAQVSAEFGLPEPVVRTGKLGRKLYLEIDYLVEEDEGWSISEADRVRRALAERLRQPGRLLWISVELHTDPNWDID